MEANFGSNIQTVRLFGNRRQIKLKIIYNTSRKFTQHSTSNKQRRELKS